MIQTIHDKFEILDNMMEGMISDENFKDLYFEARVVKNHVIHKKEDLTGVTMNANH